MSDLEKILREKIKEYDEKRKELDSEWKKIESLKPKNMNHLEFGKLLQQARYETKQSNLDREMIDNFIHNNPLKVKEWIYKGANKCVLYDYDQEVNKNSFNRTMIQQGLLEDLYNIKEEKNYPYEYDNEISDPKTITEEEFNKLFKKFETMENGAENTFTIEEMDLFLLKDGNSYVAINNLSGNLYTEDFNERNLALRFLEGEDLDELRAEECKYEVSIYETKEDYDNGESFQLNVYSDFDEALKELKKTIKLNTYYSGFILNQKNGKEEFSMSYNESKELDEEEEDERE